MACIRPTLTARTASVAVKSTNTADCARRAAGRCAGRGWLRAPIGK